MAFLICDHSNSRFESTGLFSTGIQTEPHSGHFNGKSNIEKVFTDSEKVDASCIACKNQTVLVRKTVLHEPPRFICINFNLFNNQLRKIEAISDPFTTVQITTSQGPVAYTVIATVEHIGSQISNGHYVAHIVKHGNWFRCDDTNIQKVDDQTPTKKPYLVILRKSD